MQDLAPDLNASFSSIAPQPATMPTETYMHGLAVTLGLLLFPIITAFYVHKDYCAFLSLGPGGTPATPLGYLKIKLLSLICLRDPRRPIPIPPHYRPQRGYFFEDALPHRTGHKPEIRGIAPQRQQTQVSTKEIYGKLVLKIKELASDPRNRLTERTSCFEKHSTGLFTSIPITRTCGGEICHAHPSDGSMHLTLHPADANLIMAHGWGERHPLARGGWCRKFVPREFMLVYAPRDDEEVEIVTKIVAASIWWVSGINVSGDTEGPRRKSADVAAIGREMQGDQCWACRVNTCGGNKVEQMASDA
ncbi:hypothetical protein COCMIDRAFT_10268 [Bipolaris oryzae ATCC 44560]|uniref:Luciferase domain-containing protein n=1 Tax=Bipolaris oryzae ATCC 44560 TaxID=930090 RepID=W6YPY3_COCMI|nr:uncharacterized protein COCMIDRAFT_10268 [Bipolaris oryzae ATCC 44560]EUC39665.1 hypothetical protein COCMIDRAFT_10268 [Bipolaris oryzae ATCC 44560]